MSIGSCFYEIKPFKFYVDLFIDSLYSVYFRNRNHSYFRVSEFSNDYEDDSSTYPLQPTINTQTNFNILEAQIQEGDTLQAIALRFNCSVSISVIQVEAMV